MLGVFKPSIYQFEEIPCRPQHLGFQLIAAAPFTRRDAMVAQIPCPHCQQLLSIDEKYYGMQVNCPLCQGALIVPRPAASRPSAAPHTGPPRGQPSRPRTQSPYVASAAASSSTLEERKAKFLLGGMLVGGVALLAGLLYLGSQFLEKPHGENSISEEVAAINANRTKEDEARRAQQEKELEAEQNKQRAAEVDRMAKIFSLSVTGGDDEVAVALAKELMSITDEMDKASELRNPPENPAAYIQQKLMVRITENATLRHWFGKRSAEAFAQSMAASLVDTPKPVKPVQRTPTSTPAIRSEPLQQFVIPATPPQTPPQQSVPLQPFVPPPPPPGADQVPAEAVIRAHPGLRFKK